MNKKTERYLDCLVGFFTRSIYLGVVSRIVKQFYPKLVKERDLKLTQKLWVLVGYKLTGETPVDKVMSSKECMSSFLGGKGIFAFDQSDCLGKLVHY